MQAEWLEDCSQLKKRARGPPICGEVTSVSLEPQLERCHRLDAGDPKPSTDLSCRIAEV